MLKDQEMASYYSSSDLLAIIKATESAININVINMLISYLNSNNIQGSDIKNNPPKINANV